MRELTDELSYIGVTTSGCIINNLRCADDVLTAMSPNALLQLIDKVSHVSKQCGLEISVPRMKIMAASTEKMNVKFTCNNEHLEQVDS